jgi:hypothetical protein
MLSLPLERNCLPSSYWRSMPEIYYLTIRYVSSMCKLYVSGLWQQEGIQSLQVLNSHQQWINVLPLPGTLAIESSLTYISVLMITNTDLLVLTISLHAGQLCRSTVFTGSEAYRVLTASYRRCFQIHCAPSIQQEYF